jgi:hypothetical protein
MAKTSCPVTRAEFLQNAQAVEVVVNGVPLMAEVKEFSTGSLGWYLNGKTTIRVNDKPVSVQIGMNLTIVGSQNRAHRDDCAVPCGGVRVAPRGPAVGFDPAPSESRSRSSDHRLPRENDDHAPKHCSGVRRRPADSHVSPVALCRRSVC